MYLLSARIGDSCKLGGYRSETFLRLAFDGRIIIKGLELIIKDYFLREMTIPIFIFLNH